MFFKFLIKKYKILNNIFSFIELNVFWNININIKKIDIITLANVFNIIEIKYKTTIAIRTQYYIEKLV